MKLFSQISCLFILLMSVSCQTELNKTEIASHPGYEEVKSFSEGYAAVKKDGKWGYIDKTGTLRVPFKYDNAKEFYQGIAFVEEGIKKGYINQQGQYISYNPCQYDTDDIGLHLDEQYLQNLIYATFLTRDSLIYLLHPKQISGIGEYQGTGIAKAKQSIEKYLRETDIFDRQVAEIIATLSLVKDQDFSTEINFFKNLQELRKKSADFLNKAQNLQKEAEKSNSPKEIAEVKKQAQIQIEQIKKFLKSLKKIEE